MHSFEIKPCIISYYCGVSARETIVEHRQEESPPTDCAFPWQSHPFTVLFIINDLYTGKGRSYKRTMATNSWGYSIYTIGWPWWTLEFHSMDKEAVFSAHPHGAISHQVSCLSCSQAQIGQVTSLQNPSEYFLQLQLPVSRGTAMVPMSFPWFPFWVSFQTEYKKNPEKTICRICGLNALWESEEIHQDTEQKLAYCFF